jgi:UDP-N-acetylglucosamine 4,6-dehydratase/5-epimerase
MKDIYLITGGTGSFGIAVLERLLKNNNFAEIRIFSRDDRKHTQMKSVYNDSRVKYYIGDIKDKQSIDNAMQNVDYVFHAAALKTVSTCETNPLESVKVNIIGSYNVLQSAIENKIKKIVFLSTDKVIYPISVMGASKLLMERLVTSSIKDSKETKVVITRFGNIINSNGSVTEKFLNKISNQENLLVTGKNMTRFMMTADEAVDLVFYAFQYGEHGSTYVSKMSSFYIDYIAQAFIVLTNSSVGIEYTPPRSGDKVSERLVTIEEEKYLTDEGDFYKITANQTNGLDTKSSSDSPMSLEDTINYFKYLF